VGPALTTPDRLDEVLGNAADFVRNDTSLVSAGALAQVAVDFVVKGLNFPGPAPIYLRAPDVTVVP